MKKLLFVFTLAIMFSCASDDSNSNPETETNIPFLAFDFKNFNASGMVTDSTRYFLNNEGKISNYSNNSANGLFTYTDNLLSTVERFTGGQISLREQYNYDSQNLIEVLSENYSSATTEYNRIQYQYSSTDTIYVTDRNSNDGVNYNINISDSKIVLDSNDNRTYFENYDYINDETTAVISEYDSNNNLIKETFYNDYGSGLVESYNNTLSFSNDKNSLYEVYKRTYTRRNLMITYHLQGNAVNQINGKSISVNNVNTFNTTFGSIFSFEIDNIVGNDNYSTSNSFKTYADSNLIRHFEYSFVQ